MEHSPSRDAKRFSASRRNSPHFMKPESSLPHSQTPATCPSSRCCEMIRNTVSSFGEELLARPNPQARGPPLVGCPRLLNQYILSYRLELEGVPPSATWGRAVLWWTGPTYHGEVSLFYVKTTALHKANHLVPGYQLSDGTIPGNQLHLSVH